MKEDQFVAQVKELLEINDVEGKIQKLIRKAYNSGAIEREGMKEGDFRKAKIVLCAIFKELAWQFQPLNDEDKKEAANLENFI